MSPSFKRHAVTMMGALTLVSAAAHFVGVGLAFHDDFGAWGDFFVPNILFFLYIPIIICVLYFYARVQLGRSLLGQGALEDVVAWCKPRLQPNFWLLSRREALIQRVILAQAYMRDNAYHEAKEVLWPPREEAIFPDSSKELLELARWRIEWALRTEDLVLAKEVYEQAKEMTRPRPQRAALMACRAEVALRSHDGAARRDYLEQARWVDPTNRRSRVVAALGTLQDGGSREALEEALEELEAVMPRLNREVPGRAPELWLAHAQIARALGRDDLASDSIEQAAELVRLELADQRAALLVAQEGHVTLDVVGLEQE